jgi:predicted transcriptional regulator
MSQTEGSVALLAWMAEHRHSQSSVAALVGVSQVTVSNWLHVRAPKLKDALALKELTGIEVDKWGRDVAASPRRRRRDT